MIQTSKFRNKNNVIEKNMNGMFTIWHHAIDFCKFGISKMYLMKKTPNNINFRIFKIKKLDKKLDIQLGRN